MGDSVEASVEDLDLPFYVFLIVVLSRAFYAGIVTLGVVAIITSFIDIPTVPSFGMGVVNIGVWLGIFILVAVSVIYIGFKVWIILSWMTASLFSSDLREAILEVYNEKQDSSE